MEANVESVTSAPKMRKNKAIRYASFDFQKRYYILSMRDELYTVLRLDCVRILKFKRWKLNLSIQWCVLINVKHLKVENLWKQAKCVSVWFKTMCVHEKSPNTENNRRSCLVSSHLFRLHLAVATISCGKTKVVRQMNGSFWRNTVFLNRSIRILDNWPCLRFAMANLCYILYHL